MRTIALFGLFGGGNLGNEASLATVLAALRARDAEARYLLISAPPPPVAAIEGTSGAIAHDLLPVSAAWWKWLPFSVRELGRALLQLATEPLRILRTRRAVRAFDVLIVPGTGIADDYGVGPFDVPIHIARWCRAAKRAGKPVLFLSIGAGPVTHPLSRRWFRQALSSASYRSYREASSHAFALELDIDAGADPILPDMVFGAPLPTGPEARSLEWPPRVIAVGVMGYFGWEVTQELGAQIYAGYLDKLMTVLRELIGQGHTVRLITGNRTGDARVVADVVERIGREAPQLAPRLIAAPIASYRDVLREIAAADLVIATRFHNVLKALLLRRPVISVGYARKNDDLMEAMGCGRYCHAIESFDPAAVLGQFRELRSLPEPPVAQLTKRVTEYRVAIDAQFDRVQRLLSEIRD